jgi:hypothetical protein
MEDARARSPDSGGPAISQPTVKNTCRCKVAQPVMPVMLVLGQGPASSRLGQRTHGHDRTTQGDVVRPNVVSDGEVRKRRGQSNVGEQHPSTNTIFGHVTMDLWLIRLGADGLFIFLGSRARPGICI